MWKQILNNLWGKMGQRPNRPKTKVVSDPKEYFDLLTSSGVEVTNANIINDEVIHDGPGPHQVVQGYASLGSARVLLRYGQYHLHGERRVSGNRVVCIGGTQELCLNNAQKENVL